MTKKLFKFSIMLVAFFAISFLAGCVKKHEHNIKAEWQTSETEHWHMCDGCEELFDKANHTFNSGEVTKTPTDNEEGIRKFTCTVCGYSYTEKIAKTNHVLTIHAAVDATCTEGGNTEYYSCSNCNKYFKDAETTTEIAENSWLVEALGHDLVHHEAVEATITSEGNIEYWSCSRCDKKFSDSLGTEEIFEVNTQKLVASVAQAKGCEPGDELVVRGVVVGVAGTAASINLTTMVLLKDENSNMTIALGGAKDTPLNTALVSSAELGIPYEKGTVIEIPVTLVESPINYANGQAGLRYLSYKIKEADLETYVKGTIENYKYNHAAEDVVSITSQADFFRFMGLANGSNDTESEGYAYDYHVAASNAFKVIKFTGLNAIPYGSKTTKYESQYYRFAVDSTVDSLAKQYISPTGKNGANQNLSAVFRNNNTFVNAGRTFSDLVYGINTVQSTGNFASPLTFSGEIYAMYVGGNDYYAQFIILDVADVIPSGL